MGKDGGRGGQEEERGPAQGRGPQQVPRALQHSPCSGTLLDG